MEHDIFFLDSSQAAQLAENQNWIEDLFRVGITLESDSTNDPDLCRCTLSSSGQNAQEILVKAKVCIQTFRSCFVLNITSFWV